MYFSFSFISCILAFSRATKGSSEAVSWAGFAISKDRVPLSKPFLLISAGLFSFKISPSLSFSPVLDSAMVPPSFFNFATSTHIFAKSFSRASSRFFASSIFFLYSSSPNSFSARAASRAASLCFLACSSILRSSTSKL
uniref:Secreted protein n=1 Tax=Opuntia streptacantha TaxID=393608 RepID=A0A7C9E386_OPUST